MTDSQQTKIYGLLGYPLGHSFSQRYFTEKFQREGINARYQNFELPTIEDIRQVVTQNPTISGLNVTIPYKKQVIPYLQSLDTTAAEIGAVNVIKVIRDESGRVCALRGYNSDCIGFMDSIRPLLRPDHRQALILGTGGASKAVAYGLKQLGLVTKHVSRQAIEGALTYQTLKEQPELLKEYTVIVNTTPLGMYPHIDTCPDIPYDAITPDHLCFDVVYNPETTEFMRRCAAHGATTQNGLEMLHGQAIAAWKIWNE